MDPSVLERELAVQTAKALEENATSAKPKPEQVIHNNIIRADEEVPCREHAAGPGLRHQPRSDHRAGRKRAGVEITGYARVSVGEGIEKKEEDFAAEVAKALQG